MAAVVVVFTGAGLAMASAVSRMPQIKEQVGASATELAFALVCVGVGSIVAMPFAGRLTSRFGTAAVTIAFTTVALTGWALIPLAHSVPQLAAILALTGCGVGTWDVAMNVQGSIIERKRSQVLMPLWHGMFSVGGVVGALAGAAAARIGISIAWQLPVASVVLWLAVVFACLRFLPNDPYPSDPTHDTARPEGDVMGDTTAASDKKRRHPSKSRITGLEILLGLIILGTAIGEGAANDWLAVALVDGRGAPAAVGALAYAGFNVTMAIGRFTGGVIIAHIGRAAALRAAGIIAIGGVLLLCLVPLTWTAFVGAAAWGLGFSIVFPSAMSAAGEIPGRRERAIAVVSTVGYGGFLLGAPMIGTLAHVIPLLDALLVVAAFALLIVLLAPAARERRGVVRTIGRGNAAAAPETDG